MFYSYRNLNQNSVASVERFQDEEMKKEKQIEDKYEDGLYSFQILF